MSFYSGKLTVVTGGESGMGQALVRRLVLLGCDVAACDIQQAGLDKTLALCAQDTGGNKRKITTHIVDVADERSVLSFRDKVAAQHDTDRVDVLFNNAGISGGGSLFTDPRAAWDRTFNVCWNGVYYCTRAFLDMVVASSAGRIVNTSSVNGLIGTLGSTTPHTAYCAAKFAVRGFTEALMIDLAVNAPHVRCAVVFPGHVGTGIVQNTVRVLSGNNSEEMNATEIATVRQVLRSRNADDAVLDDIAVKEMVTTFADHFVDAAPTDAAQAAKIILDAVEEGRWRILIGDDAAEMDRVVRADPEGAYDVDLTSIFPGLR